MKHPNHIRHLPTPIQYPSINLRGGDTSLLRRFIHGLAIGKQFSAPSERRDIERSTLYQKEYNSSYTAAETIRTGKGGGHRAGPLKNYLSDMLTASNVKDSVIDLFSKMGLCKSKNYITLSSDKAVQEKIRRGWDPTGLGYGLIVGAYDNMGFRKIKGYVQFTLLSIIFVSAAFLISIGVYPDPKLNPEEV